MDKRNTKNVSLTSMAYVANIPVCHEQIVLIDLLQSDRTFHGIAYILITCFHQ